METKNVFCDQCGSSIDPTSAHCPACGLVTDPARQAPRKRRLLKRHGLILGLIPWFAFLLYMGYAKSPYFKTAAVVNDQRISVSELNREAEELYRVAENQGNILTDALRARIQAAALDSLINRVLVETAAREQGIQTTEQEVSQAVSGYRAQAGLASDEDFREFIASSYGSESRFRQVFRTNQIFRSLINSSGIREDLDPVERRRQVNAWLVGLQRSSSVKILAAVPSTPGGGSGCSSGGCSSGSGSACGKGGTGGCSSGPKTASPELEKTAGALALEKAREELGSTEGLTSKVLDYGCHVEVQVIRNDEVVRTYGYQNGRIEEI